MNREEGIVLQYLESQGLRDIVYEPDGNVPPDFALRETVGVEVRRLNQQYPTGGGLRGLEEDEIPLIMAVRDTLAELGPPNDARSWFVGYHIRRPVAPMKTMKRRLREWLRDWRPEDSNQENTLSVSGVEFEVIPAGDVHPQKFLLGWTSDWDSGGWLFPELERNIRFCIQEKREKVAPYLAGYREWWLALVDYIGYGLQASDRNKLLSLIKCSKPWSRIIIVNPLHPEKSFSLDDG